ncbi:MAG: hypothetical protein H6Q65_250 [Firmicutes bacterium]|nr:hypothetical protein [Bacillota bacterium]
MNLLPIDLQVMIPRVSEVGKVQQISDRQQMLQHQQVADQWVDIANLRNSQVQNIHKSDSKKVRSDNQERGSFSSSKRHNENNIQMKNEEEDQAPDFVCEDPVRGHNIDIKT